MRDRRQAKLVEKILTAYESSGRCLPPPVIDGFKAVWYLGNISTKGLILDSESSPYDKMDEKGCEPVDTQLLHDMLYDHECDTIIDMHIVDNNQYYSVTLEGFLA